MPEWCLDGYLKVVVISSIMGYCVYYARNVGIWYD